MSTSGQHRDTTDTAATPEATQPDEVLVEAQDTEGHRSFAARSVPDEEDTEGHKRF